MNPPRLSTDAPPEPRDATSAAPGARAGAAAGELHVLFRVGDAEYAVATRDVAQMESWSGATPVPGTLPYVVGIVQVRGKVIPVIDLRRRFGLAPAEPTADSRVVVVTLEDRTVGLLVDSSREVVALAPEQIAPPPSLLVTQSAGLVRGVAQIGPRMVLLVDLPTLLNERSSPTRRLEDPHHG